MPDWFHSLWPWLSGATIFTADLTATAHVILHKRDVRGAIGWAGLIWLTPGVGPILYYLLGINRIRRKAKRLKGRQPTSRSGQTAASPEMIPDAAAKLVPLVRLVGNLTGKPLLHGNAIQPLHSGTEAYAEMIAAIDGAAYTVGLSTYIFDNDAAGKRFVEALSRAVARGVAVKVLIDDVGARYSWPRTVIGSLRHGGVKVARFLPQLLPWYFTYANLRNHRKILVVDGRTGFTGGMNIRAGHDPSLNPKHPIVDLHFRLEGPTVSHLRETFADDWLFCTAEKLEGKEWFPPLIACGPSPARGIRGGPDDDFEQLEAVYLAGLASARESVRIVSPYFLPETALIAGLNGAALRGVKVDIVLPAKNNLRMVQWACQGQLGQVLEHGCRVWLSPPPFEHTKLMIVDRAWTLFGTSNWDPRSLRLNFEFDVECYDLSLAESLDDRVARTIAQSQAMTRAEIEAIPLPWKLRNGVARLLIPYL
jgi:cardiolipin synthase